MTNIFGCETKFKIFYVKNHKFTFVPKKWEVYDWYFLYTNLTFAALLHFKFCISTLSKSGVNITCVVVVEIYFFDAPISCKAFLQPVVNGSSFIQRSFCHRPCFAAANKDVRVQLILGLALSSTKQGVCVAVWEVLTTKPIICSDSEKLFQWQTRSTSLAAGLALTEQPRRWHYSQSWDWQQVRKSTRLCGQCYWASTRFLCNFH